MSELGEVIPLMYACKYQVNDFIMINEDVPDDNLYFGSSNILNIEYINDYEFNIFPVLKVNIRMDIRQRIWILKNKTSIKVKFELDRIGVDVDGLGFNTGTETIWNLEMFPYFNDDDDATDVEMLESRLALNAGDSFQLDDIETENYFEGQNTMDIYLFNATYQISARKQFNKVYTKDTLQNIITHMLKDTGHKDVLMSKLENDEVYQEILIPPNPLYKGLMYLDQTFGLYKTGAMIYYDIDTLYIINSNGKVTAKREDEWSETVFLITQMESSVPGNVMIEVEDQEIFYVQVSESGVNIQKPSIIENEATGGNSRLVFTDSVENTLVEADQSFVNRKNENIIYTTEVNKFTETAVKARLDENEAVLYINGENFDINAFKLNKEYKVVFDEVSRQEKYGDMKFRLVYAHHFIKLESEFYMTSAHNLVFKRTEGGTTSGSE